jgi:hypothetical protein
MGSKMVSSTTSPASWWPNKLSRIRSSPSLAMTIIWPFVIWEQRQKHSATTSWHSSRAEVISLADRGPPAPAWIFKFCSAKHTRLMLRVQGWVSRSYGPLRRRYIWGTYGWNMRICAYMKWALLHNLEFDGKVRARLINGTKLSIWLTDNYRHI